MKKKAALILDCDGVMFDSRQANVNFYNHILARFHLPPLTEEQTGFVHMHTADESIRCLFKGRPQLEEAQEYRLGVDYTPFVKDMILEPGLKNLLRTLKPRMGLAVATNRSNTIQKVLRMNGLDPYFDIVVSSLDVQTPKPHPECILKVLRFFSIPAAHAFYVGDSPIDGKTARAAGVPFIGYKNPSLEADYHAGHPGEILQIVTGSGLLEG
ncbi:MAG: HAD-IA family hydrolase [Thermodesulfobacteriota bacterium]